MLHSFFAFVVGQVAAGPAVPAPAVPRRSGAVRLSGLYRNLAARAGELRRALRPDPKTPWQRQVRGTETAPQLERRAVGIEPLADQPTTSFRPSLPP